MKSGVRALLLLAGCAALASQAAWALPDLARGKAALARGDLPLAEADLVPLAERGYLEAQVGLARLYGSLDTPPALAKAVFWARAAAQKDPSMRVLLARSLIRSGASAARPTEVEELLKTLVAENEAAALPLQLRLYREIPELIETPRAALIAQKVASSHLVEERAEAMGWYRDNRAVDPAYEKALASLCEKDRGAVEECYPDLTRHFRVVGDVGALTALRKEAADRFEAQKISAETLERVARYLSADDLPGKPMTDVAYALLATIKDPSPSVMTRRARLLIMQPNLDPSANPEELLKKAVAMGSVEAEIQLGRLYLDEYNPAADPREAQRLLNEAAQTMPAAHTWLGRLYERGYLGLPDPAQALNHYLIAARAGNSNADLALSRMYTGNRGIQVDPVKAYIFAKLAEHADHPGAKEVLDALTPTLTAEQAALGLRLAQAELAARNAAAAQPGADGAVAAAGTPSP